MRKFAGRFTRMLRKAEELFFPSIDGDEEEEALRLPTLAASMIVERKSGERYPLSFKSDIIGTDAESCSLCFPEDGKLEKNHAEIRAEKYGFVIEDLGSASGTFLNNERLRENKAVPLEPADLIKVGERELVFVRRQTKAG